MNTGARNKGSSSHDSERGRRRRIEPGVRLPQLAPVARAVALTLAAGSLIGTAHAQRAFSPGWFAAKGAVQQSAAQTGLLPNGLPANPQLTPQGQSAAAREALTRSIANLNLAARGIAAQQSAQAAAREAALAAAGSVPDGLGEGGLKVDTHSLTAGWLNANAPTQTVAEGKTTVKVAQTADKAILNWESFNVGKNTTLAFEQQASWSVLNRVNDPQARPSQIQGQIKADGTVLVVNRNGIVFGGSSQVNTRNLVAAAVGMSDAQFNKGLYSEAQGQANIPSFANDLSTTASSFSHGPATGSVQVQAGARINTHAPASVTEGGGYVLLLGKQAHNAGQILTPSGQTVLAAGDAFVIKKGMASDANQNASTRGNVVSTLIQEGSGAGLVVNTGLIQAPTGDISLVGREVRQQGVAVATTSVHTRGTVHLSNAAGDEAGQITLDKDSVTAIVLDESAATALDTQRDTLIKDSDKAGDGVQHRRDQSLVLIDSAGSVDFATDSLTLATGGQIFVNAAKADVRQGAQLDVSGAVGVRVAMESNNVLINVQGNEQRDAPINRDSRNLNNKNIWVDRRSLVFVKAGTNGYETDRWYTAGGLLEVGGYLGITGHGVGEWMAQGGTVQFAGAQLNTHEGSLINLAGGTLDVQTGYVNQSWLKGSDGRIYSASKAPGDLLYTGLYEGYELKHKRWGVTETFVNPLIAPGRRLENGYTVGRDAGRLVVATSNASLHGALDTGVYQGPQQTRARDAGLDGYRQAQTAVAQRGQLVVGSWSPLYDKDSGQLRYGPDAVASEIAIGGAVAPDAEPVANHIALDASWINAQQLGGFEAYAQGRVTVDEAIAVATGGTVALHASDLRVDADISARSGSIRLGNMVVMRSTSSDPWLEQPVGQHTSAGYERQVTLGQGVTLDARGVWTNMLLDGGIGAQPFIDGGSVSIRSSGSVLLAPGSLIDVSSGGMLDVKGKLTGGRGGSVTLASGLFAGTGVLTLDGTLRGHGIKGGGALNIEHGTMVSIGGDLPQAIERLAAGEVSELPLRLAEDVELPAGSVIPASFSVTVTRVNDGQAMPVTVRPLVSLASPVTIQAPWTLPVTVQLANNGPVVYAGTTLPAGTSLGTITDLPKGYVLPPGVFPAGLPIPPQTFNYVAGNVTAEALRVPAGTRIPAGTAWQQDIAVQSFLALSADTFQSGFRSYSVTGRDGVVVVPGAQLDVSMPLLRVAPTAMRSIASGEELSPALSLWLPPLQQDDPVRGQVSLRAGASLALQAGDAQGSGDFLLGAGSRIAVDPGQALSITGNGQVTVEGSLVAHGGRISVLSGDLAIVGSNNLPGGTPNARSFWIGENALLDASGQAYTAVAPDGRRYGQVLKGGTIEIGGRHGAQAGMEGSVNAFVVVREGARLDASGAQAVLDLPALGTTTLASDGGAIGLSSGNGLFIDGDLRAAAGGAGAVGGTLSLLLETPTYGSVDRFTLKGEGVSDAVRVPRELVIEQVYGGSGLASGVQVGQLDASLAYGSARYGVDAIHAGGFDTASLAVNGLLSFDGNVELRLPQAIHLTASSLNLSTAAARDSQVSLAAPYLRLAGSTGRQLDNTIMPNPVFGSKNISAIGGTLGTPLLAADARLTLSGSLVDIVGEVGMGTRGTIVLNAAEPLSVPRDAFGQVRIESKGDLRLRNAIFASPGDTTLAAAQIYGSGNVIVGTVSELSQWGTVSRSFDPTRVLNIERMGDSLPPMPYDVFGTLGFGAATINQGGVLRAPLGSITLGTADGNGYTGVVNLLPGSITSVSADGLVMPYGGTVDGLIYNYNGVDVVYQGIGFEPKVEFRSHAVQVQEGAVVDLSGGGTLTGAAFLQGRGGSTDARLNPLVQVKADGSGFTLPSLSTNPVYAIVPGVQPGAAPLGAEKGAGDPALGRQVTIGQGVPGLPAGTYTLLPSTYALLPGAFRVELNGSASQAAVFGTTTAMRNGSYATAARLGIANTGALDTLSTAVILTPADTLRSYSQYNETSYADFALQQAMREGVPRPLLERDGKALSLALSSPGSEGSFNLPQLGIAQGTIRVAPGEGGHGSVTRLWNAANYELLADGSAPTEGFNGVSVLASQLNATNASRLEVGGALRSTYSDATTGQLKYANIISIGGTGGSNSIVLREGAVLQAADVFLMTGRTAGSITVEQGATISTLGRGASSYGGAQGYIYRPGQSSVLALSNGQLDLLAPQAPGANSPESGAGAIEIGVCATGGACTADTRLYSEGTIATATDNRFVLGDTVRYGTRNLSLALGAVNVGSNEALAAAAARGVLTPGMTLNQELVDRLLLGDTSVGAPALEALSFTVRESVNFFGDVTLSTYDANGRSALQRLVLGTPAIYGHGSADAVARIHTDTLIWTGALTPAGGVVADGAGTGSGQLVVDAREIVFGWGPRTQPDTVREQHRIALGFGNVHLNASERVTATHKGTLSVYQSQGAWNADTKAFDHTGGTLHIGTPLMTGSAGSVNRITAGGDIRVAGGGGAAAASNAALADALGAEIALDSRGGNLLLDTAVLLPSGKLGLSAQGDVTLADGAQLDLAGRKIDFFDVSKYSWGGDLVLTSRAGGVRQAAGSVIDLSAEHNRAGKLTALATQAEIALAGRIDGSSSGHYDAGGTQVPYMQGRIDLHGRSIADFAGLNTRLTEGGMVGGRSFRIGQGDLAIGDELKAHEINVSLDNGQLSVNGRIDASGEQAGSIRLAANNGVSLAGTAVLDASASVLRADSYGKAIEASNRAVIEIDSGDGTLRIVSGARMDLSVAGAPANYGTVALNAPRLGSNDVAIDAAGTVSIDGAKAIHVNAFISDDTAAVGTDATADGKSYQVIDQAYLDRLHGESNSFIDAALANGNLMNAKLAGLRRYADQFHLRPGVQVVADLARNADGNLHVDGDIDLSGHRYASVNPRAQKNTLVHGSGEAGALVMRAQGDLEVFGSISDGFDGSRLPSSFDSNGWVLTKGRQLWGSDVVVPHGGMVALQPGTIFNSGKVLNYALPIQPMLMAPATLLPVQGELAQALLLAPGTVLSANVRGADGTLLFAAGTVLADAVTLPSGTRLDAGFRLPVAAHLAAMTWPAGVALPAPPVGNAVVLSTPLTLAKGALIPSDTHVVLPGGVDEVDLRPRDGDGNQGRIWAVAPMLPAGLQSWDLSLVAGADASAADRLATRHGTPASLRFSDAHYGRVGEVQPVPGTGSPATYKWGDLTLFEQLVIDFWGEYVMSFVPVQGEPITPAQAEEVMNMLFAPVGDLNTYGYGELTAIDQPAVPPDMAFSPRAGVREQLSSVVRTGTGDLRLVSAGDIATSSLYGIYTAGTPSAALPAVNGSDRYNLPRSTVGGLVLGALGEPFEAMVDGGAQSLYAAWYPESGGNLLMRAGRNISGDSLIGTTNLLRFEGEIVATSLLTPTSSVGNWLWRQGTGSVQTGAEAVPAAWWINFGTYVRPPEGANYYGTFDDMPRLVGFTGYGTLGGGNLVLEAGGNAGMLQPKGDHGGAYLLRSTGLNLAVASTGRVTADGGLVLTGGGDLDIRIGGGLNADPALNAFTGSNFDPVANSLPLGGVHRLEVNGSIANLRGALRMETGAVGTVALRFGTQNPKDSRPGDVFSATSASSAGGPVLLLGDSTARIDARGDLVLGSAADPGRGPQLSGGTPFSANGWSYTNGGYSWFSLWTPSTAIDLLAAGGSLTPTLNPVDGGQASDAAPTDMHALYPSVFRAAAANGSVFYGSPNGAMRGVTLAPSPVSSQFAVGGTGQLELLAADSLHAAGANFSASGADPTRLVSPFNPGFVGYGDPVWYGRHLLHNVSADAVAPGLFFSLTSGNTSYTGAGYTLFPFVAPSASGHVHVGQQPARYYAVQGDIVGARTGSIIYLNSITGVANQSGMWYDGGGAVAIRAGRDITDSGTPLGSYDNGGLRNGAGGWTTIANAADPSAPHRPAATNGPTMRGNLIVHTSADDVSVVQAGRDVRYSSFYIAGPGLLDVSAGRDLYMADKGELRSLGPVANVVPGDRSSGAGIAAAAGMGRDGADWRAFAARYLDAANVADAGRPLADQQGKVVRAYVGSITLSQWLAAEFGYTGDEAGAQAFMAAQQATLDQARRQALASGGTASNRDLAREYKLESQLHLVNWLTQRFGGANGRGLHFDAATMDARAFFDALPIEQQRVFLRNVYYAELKAAGREYNQVDGPRQGSYLRGREAIATLLPTQDAQGQAIDYEGDLTMFSSALYYPQYVTEELPRRRPVPGVEYVREDEWIAMGSPGYSVPFYKVNDAGIHTDFGGNISLMVPGGRTLVGVDGGFNPGAGSGVLTQGEGDINIFSQGDILMGQSRIFTTFGGNILAWSAEGDINAGRGAKTTVVATPQRRVYDSVGNVSLSPSTPNTGAGIATLNPIPEVPPGDVDLIAPLGTIDAGEAGIRVSGNVNLAALQVLNAENIQVQGEAVGIPVVAAVNIGALTNASAAAQQATTAAQEVVQRERAAARQALPSVFTVRVVGFGNDAAAPAGGSGAQAPAVPAGPTARYDPASFVQLVGQGSALRPELLSQLTDAERRELQRTR
ncbi:filamentous hemagglutinin family protein [Xenophilus arseniciresistens]|uniref:Filamentous hemagglutinin family protein n=1 Tax=Xenophilus arseniciresistens TaxID=1283306 RepID=A0AAE3N603_9BURK|nr:filamentous haemagglutinin family protein [Xenophilus arseniciresistens]MDA7415001.1 filamentous hemagglutinin family protein [Xenophilus arseniciresistens]